MDSILRHLNSIEPRRGLGRPILDADTFVSISDVALQSPFFKAPEVFVSDDCGRKDKLEAIVRRFGGSISDFESAKIAVYPGTLSTSPLVPVRALEYEASERKVLVHFVGLPESNDAWVNENSLENFNGVYVPSEPSNHLSNGSHSTQNGPKRVNESFLLDLELFGEWLQPLDYAIGNWSNDGVLFRSKSKKRTYYDTSFDSQGKESDDMLSGRKRKVKVELPHSSSPSRSHSANSPPVTPSSSTGTANYGARIPREVPVSKAYSILAQPSLSGLKQDSSTLSSKNSLNPSTNGQFEREGDEETPTNNQSNRFSEAQPSIVVPHHSSWFNMADIHEYEKKALPEFFQERPARSSNKSAEIYREYRDFMIHTYQQNPAHFLNYTSCRRALAGDACSVLRVFDFLSSVSLINYAVNPDIHGILPSPAPIPPAIDQVKPLLRIDTTPSTGARSSKTAIDENLVLQNFETPHASHTTSSVGTESSQRTSQRLAQTQMCSQCGSTYSKMRYRNKTNSTVFCLDCFHEQVNESAREDYILIDDRPEAILKDDSNPWKQEETLRLIDAIEKFGDDWEKVAAAVGTRDVESCILHFIRLPIEDAYYDTSSGFEKTQKDLEAAGYPANANASAPNPVMLLTAFLTRTLSPKIASAASIAAIKAFLNEKGLLASTSLSNTNSGSKDMNEESSNAMDVDSKQVAPEPLDETELGEDGEILKDLTAVASASLAAAVLKATLLAQKEECDMRRAVLQMVDAQFRKMELKMKYFEEMEKFLDDEHKRLEAKRVQVLEEKWQIEQEKRRLYDQRGGSM